MPRKRAPEMPKLTAPSELRVSPPDARPHARRGWEYCAAISEDGQSYYLRDQSYYEGGPAVSVHFNDLGADGWEVAAIYFVGDAIHAPVYYAVFKRPINV